MASVTVEDERVVELQPLHIGEEGEVGRPETGVFVELPPEGVDLIRWLAAGLPLGEVKRRFADRYGQAPDLEEFLSGIAECGFVRESPEEPETPTGMPERSTARPAPPRGWHLLAGLPAERVSWVLARPMKVLYAAIWLGVPVLLALRPGLVPSPADAWLHPSVIVNGLALTLLGWTLVLLHELAHLVALRAVGCSGSVVLSHRLHFLVAQANMTAVRTIPRARRYGPYLAGMTWDATVLMGSLLLRAAGAGGPLPGALAYLAGMHLAFQLAFFMRTDVYYVFTNLFRLGNLMEDTRRFIADLVRRGLRRPARHDLTRIPARELRLVRWYGVFLVLGVAITLGQLGLYGAPVLVRFAGESAAGLARGVTSPAFWDAAAFLGMTAANFGLLAYVMVRDRRDRLAGRAGGADRGTG